MSITCVIKQNWQNFWQIYCFKKTKNKSFINLKVFEKLQKPTDRLEENMHDVTNKYEEIRKHGDRIGRVYVMVR